MIPSSLDSADLRFTPISKAACRQKETLCTSPFAARASPAAYLWSLFCCLSRFPICCHFRPSGVLEACINPVMVGCGLSIPAKLVTTTKHGLAGTLPAHRVQRDRLDQPVQQERPVRQELPAPPASPEQPVQPAPPDSRTGGTPRPIFLCWTTVRMDLHAGPSSERRHRCPGLYVCV
jgi:hypothetical protein